jgi:antitoxin ParD1/3/4
VFWSQQVRNEAIPEERLPTIANPDTILRNGETMPTRNVNLTPQMDRLVETKIRNGQYANASEVIRAGLRALEEDEREDAARIDALREAINAGEASGLAKGDIIGRLRMRIRRRAEATGAFEE